MTTIDRFDDLVAAWLRDTGPADIRPAALAQALELAATRPQRQARLARLGGAWLGTPRARAVAVVAVGLVVALVGMAVVGNQLLPPISESAPPSEPGVPSRAPTSPPSPSAEPAAALGGGGWILVQPPTSKVHALSPDGAIDRAFDGGAWCPVLSPDGSEVGYTRFRSSGMFVTRIEDGATRQVGLADTSNTWGYLDGIWSPNRGLKAFMNSANDGLVLKVVSVFADEPSTRVVFSSPTTVVSSAAWSPDDAFLAVAHGRAGAATITILDVTGAIRQTIEPVALDPEQTMMAWAPDGRHIAVVSGFPPVMHLVDLETGTLDMVPVAGTGAFFSASPWSRDGRWLAVGDADGNLLVSTPDGRVVVHGPELGLDEAGYLPRWSPTANLVAIRTPTGLVTVDPAAGTQTELATFAASKRWEFDWSPDGSRLVIAEYPGENGELVISTLDASGRAAPVVLATYPTSAEGRLCLSWDAPTAP